ncbi:hypothetical protein Tco_0673800 [Tanacetum coccineum]
MKRNVQKREKTLEVEILLEVRRIIYRREETIRSERRRMRDVRTKSRRQLIAEERRCLVMDLENNEWYYKPAAGGPDISRGRQNKQSYDEVYGCLKDDSENNGGKRLAISMVEEAWLSEKEVV